MLSLLRDFWLFGLLFREDSRVGLGALWNWWEGLDEKEDLKRNGNGKLVRESFQLSWNLGSGELMIMIFMVAWGQSLKSCFGVCLNL